MKVITLSGLRGMGAVDPVQFCKSYGAEVETLLMPAGSGTPGPMNVCKFPDGTQCLAEKFYSGECGAEISSGGATTEDTGKAPSRLLNYAVVAGVGTIVGLIVAASKSKKGSVRLAGAGIGAATTSLLLLMTWPKEKATG